MSDSVHVTQGPHENYVLYLKKQLFSIQSKHLRFF